MLIYNKFNVLLTVMQVENSSSCFDTTVRPVIHRDRRLEYILFLQDRFSSSRSLPRNAAERIGWRAATSERMKGDTEKHREGDSNRLWLLKPPATHRCPFCERRPVWEASLRQPLGMLDHYCFLLNRLRTCRIYSKSDS